MPLDLSVDLPHFQTHALYGAFPLRLLGMAVHLTALPPALRTKINWEMQVFIKNKKQKKKSYCKQSLVATAA